MALTVEELKTKRDQVIYQMASPESVSFRDRSQTNRSQRDLLATMNQLDAEIAKLQSPQSGRTFVIQTKRGIE